MYLPCLGAADNFQLVHIKIPTHGSMESAVSFVPMRSADFVNFAGQGGAGQGLVFAGRGEAACFSAGLDGASIPAVCPLWCSEIQFY